MDVEAKHDVGRHFCKSKKTFSNRDATTVSLGKQTVKLYIHTCTYRHGDNKDFGEKNDDF